MTNKLLAIECPYCGKKYLPSEIYIPKVFFGIPSTITQNKYGELEYVAGKQMDLQETYNCDKCLHTFKVTADINFITEQIIDKDEEFILRR